MNATLARLIAITCTSVAAVSPAADFEAPSAPFQTVARPADGETLHANPPCFLFPAKENLGAYVIEFSSDAAFAPGATVRLASPYMLAVAPEAIKAGRYYWRGRPGRLDDGARVWSAVRSFVMADDAPVVPFPDVEALAKRLGTSHPRVAVFAEGLAELRRRALATFGEGWLARVRRTAEQARSQPLLPEPAFLPPRDDPNRAALYQRTFQTTRPFFAQMNRLAEDYLLTGEELSGQEAKRRLLHIIAWDPQGSTQLSHNDEVGTDVVRHCPVVFDRVYPLLTGEEKRRCLDCLTLRMQEMRGRWKVRPFEKYPYESHNMMYYLPDLLGASLAMIGEAPVEEMLRYTMLQLWSPCFPPFGGAEGGWSEGPNYWTYSTATFCHTLSEVARVTGAPVHLRSNLREMWRWKLYGNPPYFRLSPFGDGQEGRAIGGQTMLLLSAMYDNPYAKWYAQQQKSQGCNLRCAPPRITQYAYCDAEWRFSARVRTKKAGSRVKH